MNFHTMRKARFALALLAAPALLGQAVPNAEPSLAPSGKWTVQGENNMCVLLHDYGEGTHKVTIGVRPWPLGDKVDILVFQPNHARGVERGHALLMLEPDHAFDTASYVRWPMAGDLLQFTSFTMDGKLLLTLPQASTLSITLDSRTIRIAPKGGPAAFAALATCNTTLLKSLNIDPDWKAQVAKPAVPEGNVRSWFPDSIYPDFAAQHGMEGGTNMLAAVGTDGRVSRCVVFGSSGSADLDKAACSALTHSGRYRPAVDASGRPLASYVAMRLGWGLWGT